MTVKRRGVGSNVRVTKLVAGAEPVWNEIMPAGEWHRGDWGVVNVGRSEFETAIANWKKIGSPKLPIDRFHWGSSNETRVVDPKAKAAVGWIEDLRVGASGNLEGLTRWLPEGKSDIEAERYCYFSPEWHESWADNTTGESQGLTIFGGALLNDPYFLGHLQPMAANDVQRTKEHVMTREELIEMYGLSKNATDAEIRAAARKAADAVTEAKRVAAAEAEKRTTADKRVLELGDETEKLRKSLDEQAATHKTALETAQAEAKKAAEASEKRIAALEATNLKAAEETLKKETARLCERLEKDGRIVASEKAHVEEDVKTYGLEKASARWLARKPVVPVNEHGFVPRPTESGDAMEQWKSAVAEKVKAGMDEQAATRAVNRENPELYRRAAAANTNKVRGGWATTEA